MFTDVRGVRRGSARSVRKHGIRNFEKRVVALRRQKNAKAVMRRRACGTRWERPRRAPVGRRHDENVTMLPLALNLNGHDDERAARNRDPFARATPTL